MGTRHYEQKLARRRSQAATTQAAVSQGLLAEARAERDELQTRLDTAVALLREVRPPVSLWGRVAAFLASVGDQD